MMTAEMIAVTKIPVPVNDKALKAKTARSGVAAWTTGGTRLISLSTPGTGILRLRARRGTP